MSAENENWNSSNTENTENTENNREGYKSYNRENRGFSGSSQGGYNRSGYGDRPSYNRGDRPQRPRFNPAQRAYSSNGEQGRAFRPSSFGEDNNNGQQREYRPRFYGNNNENNGGYRPRNNYNAEGGSSSYNRGGQGGYNRNQQGGGYNRGGYNNRGQQGGSYNREGGYNREGSYNNNRGGGYNNRGGQGGYNNNRGGYNNNYNNRGGYQQRPRTADYNPNAKYSKKKQLEYHDALLDPNAPIRLNKFLANAGICSRREADQFIAAGVVSVNGTVVTELGSKVLPADEVKFHDQPVKMEHKVYVLLNKPKDYVTTTDDPQARKTVMQLVKDACRERIYPVGRLDRNTTGVLLLTNDGDMASKLTHPKFLKKKVYHVHLDKNVAHSDLERIAAGITLEDGEVHADAISYASETDKSQVGIEIHSGKNRIVRRIFEHLGYRVTKLDRVLFAGLTKKNLRRGDWRYLTEAEVNMLRMGAFE